MSTRGIPAIVLGLAVSLLPIHAWGVGEDPGAEVAEALRSLGPPGVLWGRLLLEEESPLGAWTPMGGVEVTVYPATPALVTELERIRQSARDSAAQYESAVARVRTALGVHQARLDGKSPETWGSDGALVAEPPVPSAVRPAGPTVATLPPRLAPERSGGVPATGARRPGGVPSTWARWPGGTPATGERAGGVATTGERIGEEPVHPWRQSTDPAGLFVYDALPSGDWLVVAIRVSAYAGQKFRPPPRQQPGAGRGFLPRTATSAREAEIWVTRVRVDAGARVGLELTDRARWLAGPVR